MKYLINQTKIHEFLFLHVLLIKGNISFNIIKELIFIYILHKGSVFHSCGNPIERDDIPLLLSMRANKRIEKFPFSAIDRSKYARQHNW